MFPFFSLTWPAEESLCSENLMAEVIKTWNLNNETVPQKSFPLLSIRTWKGGKLAQCRIPKSMHTVTEIVFGYLSDPKKCNISSGLHLGSALKSCQNAVRGVTIDKFLQEGG